MPDTSTGSTAYEVSLSGFLHFRPLVEALEKNTAGEICQRTGQALAPGADDRERLKALHQLAGVGPRVASALLHIAFLPGAAPYPILDKNALRALGCDKAPVSDYGLWTPYVAYCRQLAREADVDMRTLDRALWAYGRRLGRPRG